MFDDIFTNLEHSSDPTYPASHNPVVDRLPDLEHPLQSIVYPTDLIWQWQSTIGAFDPLDDWQMTNFDGLGTPVEDAACWQLQDGQNACAVVAQASVYEAITGIDLSEADASQIAAVHGWFNPETGTYPQDVGKLLAFLGIPTSQTYDATLADIAMALEQGDKVIVALDAHEIWQPLLDPATGQPIEQADGGHAVWVTGLDQAADGSVQLILNDSGTPNGCMMTVNAQDFLNAWQDYGNFLVVADGLEVGGG